jgi:hypothetical protein
MTRAEGNSVEGEENEMVTTTTHRIMRTAIALVALLTFLLGVAPQMKAADELTKKQAKALAATAKAPADHMRLAAYYKLEADRLDAEAKDHDDLAQVYRLHPAVLGGGKDVGNPQSRTFEHCEATAKSLREAARFMRELATEHEKMAKDASQ